jgi:hypothetical protein
MFYCALMDRNSAIERWRLPLLAEVLKLCAEIGLTQGGTVEKLPKPVHRYVLRILRTVESAARRLILAAARDIVVEYKPRPPAAPKKPKTSSSDRTKADGEAKPKRQRRPLFNLFDALKRVGRRFKKKRRGPEPRIRILGDPPDTRHPVFRLFRQPEPPPPPPAPVVEEKVDDGMVSAANLVRRLVAVVDALSDIPRHAMRLALWEAKPKEDRRPERWSPLRPGRPPGFRQRNIHEVDEILKECHWLASNGYPQLDDTS